MIIEPNMCIMNFLSLLVQILSKIPKTLKNFSKYHIYTLKTTEMDEWHNM